MWIAYPVKIHAELFEESWTKSDADFFRAAPDISRSFSVYGRPGKRNSKSFRIRGSKNPVLDGYMIQLSGIGAVAILKFPESNARTLARPHTNSTGLLLNSIGLLIDSPLTTESLAYSRNPKTTEKLRFAVNWEEGSEFAEDEYYPRFIAAVAIERMILDKAVEVLNSRFVSARKARKIAANIAFWLSRPSIESELIRNHFQDLRKKLDLDNRSREIMEALKQIISRGNAALIAGTATTAALLSIFDSKSLPITEGPLWLAIAVGSGLVAWQVVRGTRH